MATTTPTDKFAALAEETAKMGEANDCTVKAVAVVSGLSYAQAHALCARYGRRPRKGMFPKNYHMALRSLGFKVEKVEGHAMNQAKTVVTLGRCLPSRGVFLINTRGHVLAARGGKVHDWTQGRRHRVIAIFRVSRPADAGPLPEVAPTPYPEQRKPAAPKPQRRRRPARRRRSTSVDGVETYRNLENLFRLRF